MLIQQIAPVAETEFAPVFVALELSRSKWLVGVGTPQRWTVRRHQVEGGDLYGLLELLGRISGEEEKRDGLPVKVHVCFEAGRDGHWLYRALKLAGYEAYEIEPASVAVDRRARRAKSDGVDVDKLVRTARALCGASSTPAGSSRSRARRKKTPNGRDQRVRAAGQGTDLAPQPGEGPLVRPRRSRFRPDGAGPARAPGGAADQTEAEGRAHPRMPSPGRDHRRHRRGRSRDEGADRSEEGQTRKRGLRGAIPAEAKATQLYKLKSIGVHFSTVLAREVYYRTFQNRRGVGQYIGLAPSPFQSGDMARDQGIAKAGNKRARKAMIELSWLWLHHQPDSALSQWFPERVGDKKGRVRRIGHRRRGAQTRRCAVALPRDRRHSRGGDLEAARKAARLATAQYAPEADRKASEPSKAVRLVRDGTRDRPPPWGQSPRDRLVRSIPGLAT